MGEKAKPERDEAGGTHPPGDLEEMSGRITSRYPLSPGANDRGCDREGL